MASLSDLLAGPQQGSARPKNLADILAAPEAAEPSFGTAMAHAAVSGLGANVEAAKQAAALATTGTPTPAAPPAPEYANLESPLHLADILHPKKLLYQTVRGLFESAPEMAGAVAGGLAGAAIGGGPDPVTAAVGAGLGAGAVNAVKSFAPIYSEELQAHPDDKSLAFENAWKRTAIEAAATGTGFGLFGVGGKAGPFKQLMMQAFGVQPGVAVAGRVAENVATGQPAGAGAESAALGAVAGTVAPMGAHVALRGLLRYAPEHPDTRAPLDNEELGKLLSNEHQAPEAPPPQVAEVPTEVRPNLPQGETPKPTTKPLTREEQIADLRKSAETEERVALSYQQGVRSQEELRAGQEAQAAAEGYRKRADALAQLQEAAPPPQTLQRRLTSLPQATELVQGAPGVQGDVGAVKLGRRAAILWSQANEAVAEGRTEDAGRLQRDAGRMLQRANDAGFSYTSAQDRMGVEGTKIAATEVGAEAQPTPPAPEPIQAPQTPEVAQAPRAAEMRTEGSPKPAAPGAEVFRQQPALFQNPLVQLQAGLGRAVKEAGRALWTVGDHPATEAITRFIRPLQERMIPEHKLIVDTRSDSPFAASQSNGSYTGFRGGWGVIHLPEATLKNEAATAAVLAHEMGHAIVHVKWDSLPSDHQQAIYAAFGRHLQESFGDSGTAEKFLDDLHSPFALAIAKRFYDAKLGQEAVPFLRESHYGSWYSFDEWIAEQAAKWMFTNRRTLTLMDRFFKSVGNAMEKVLRTLGRKLPSFEPAKEVKAWLDGMIQRRSDGALPLTIAGTLDGYSNGVKENARALGVEPSASVVPPQGEWIGLRQANAMFGLSKKTIAEADRWSWWIKNTWNLLQLSSQNRHIAGLQAYTEAARDWYMTKMKLVSQADGRVKEWRRLGKDMAGNLSNFMYEVDSMGYLKPGENARWPTTAELVALAQKNKLSREAVGVYSKIRDDFLHVLDRVENAWTKDALRTYTDPARQAAAVAEIQRDMAQMRSRPYFPHERYGDWTIAVRDKQGNVIHYEQETTKAKAIARGRALQQQFVGGEVTTGKLPEEVRAFQGLPPSLIRSMANRLPGLTKAQQGALEDMAFSMSPANAFAKHLARRKGTPGYSMDAMRGYANYFLHAGSHIARLEHRADMEEAVQLVNNSAKMMRGVEAANVSGDRQGIADWMQRHLDYVMNPGHEWQGLRSAAFTYYLGFNVSSALMNLTQIPMVAWPYLGARFGDLSTMNALRRSAMDIHKLFALKPGTLAADEAQAIGKGIEQGFLDESLSAELSATAQGGVLSRILPSTALYRGYMGLSWMGSWLFQKAEQINRRVVFSAAYRLAKSKPTSPHIAELVASNQGLFKDMLGQGWSPTNAAAFLAGRDAIERSQFEYAAWARPEFVRGKKGALFQFWMFRQNMLWFLKNDPGSLRGFAALFAAGGLMGLPFAQDLNDFLKYVAARLGVNFNPEQEARQHLAQIMSDPDLLMHGPGRESFGLATAGEMMGIPIPSFDFSSRLGMGQLIPGMQAATEIGTPFNEKLGKVAAQAVGAAWGIPINLVKAMESNDPDEWKAYERALPLAFRNASKMIRYLMQGGETTRGGATVLDFDVTDPKALAELVGQGLGFQPTALAQKYDEMSAIQDAVKYWATRRGVLFDQFAMAARAKDREALADARQAVREYNESVPDKRLRISIDDIRQSLRSRQKANRQIEQNRAPTTYSGVAAQIRQGYPGVQP